MTTFDGFLLEYKKPGYFWHTERGTDTGQSGAVDSVMERLMRKTLSSAFPTVWRHGYAFTVPQISPYMQK